MVGKLTVQDCTSQVGNGATYVNNKVACNAASDCGAESSFPCEFTETNTWQPVVAGYANNEATCLTGGSCAAADGDVGNGATYANNKVACEAATDCGAVESTEDCIWNKVLLPEEIPPRRAAP